MSFKNLKKSLKIPTKIFALILSFHNILSKMKSFKSLKFYFQFCDTRTFLIKSLDTFIFLQSVLILELILLHKSVDSKSKNKKRKIKNK